MADGRKKNGGKRPNAGRKSKAEEMGLVALLNECWTIASRKACLKTLAKLAQDGEIQAIKLLMEYTFGKPQQPISGELRHEVVFEWTDTGAANDQD